MKTIGLFIAFASSFLAVATSAQELTLWDRVRGHDASAGPVQLGVSIQYEPKDLDALLSEADVAFEGIVVKAEVGLNDAQTAIFTTYTLKPRQALFARDASHLRDPNATITFQHVGGTLKMSGVTVSMYETRFRRLNVNENVVVFLKRSDTKSQNYVLGGPYGCFTVRGNRLAAMHASVAQGVHAEFEGADISHLAVRIQDVLSRRPR